MSETQKLLDAHGRDPVAGPATADTTAASLSVLASVDAGDVVCDPFPHVVVENALPVEVCDQLIAEFPPLEVVSEGKPYHSNKRFSYSARESLKEGQISPLWENMVRTHISQEFFDDAVRVFGDHVRAAYPQLEERLGVLEDLRVGTRKVDNYERAEVLLDGQISINTPVNETPDSVRVPHIDAPNKLFTGLLYLKHPLDDSVGGDLELYRYKRSNPRFFQDQHIERKYIDYVKTVEYKKNTLIFFVNSLQALHGVTVRQRTPHIRRFFNLVAEVPIPLFELRQENRLRRGLRRRNLFGLRTVRYF